MKCPQCLKDVPISESQYLALFTCPQCFAVYFVNADGIPEYGDMTAPDESSMGSEVTDEPLPSPTFEMPIHVHREAVESPLNDTHLESLHSIESSLTVENDIDGSLHTHMYENQNHDELSSDQNFAAGGVLGAVLQDIQSFGNQDQVVAHINYDLIVKNLDQKENLILFKEAIDDSKLGWIKEDVLALISDGQCRLTKLNAVVATVLIQRLLVSDIDIDWIQHVETL